MYRYRTHQIEDRIVNLTQPHVRPIVRGKAKAKVEFGAKIAIIMVNGYALLEKQAWDNFNEGTTLIESIETYKMRFGYYPKVVLADKIYRNRENLNFCKANGIRMSGPALGRPTKESKAEHRKLAKQDAGQRNAVEGKFGEGKRRYGLGLIQTRLRETNETVIALQLIGMNLAHTLRVLSAFLLSLLKTRF
jgi:IS5 family transposase